MKNPLTVTDRKISINFYKKPFTGIDILKILQSLKIYKIDRRKGIIP